MSQVFSFKNEGNSKQSVFIAVPSYGDPTAGFVVALAEACSVLTRHGVGFRVELFHGNCHVDDSRNYLVRNFLETECTDLLFIDADLKFEANGIEKLLGFDADVVGGVYPLKQEMEDYTVRHFENPALPDSQGLIEVEGIGTGFMRIRRSVLEALASESDHFPAKADYLGRSMIPIIFERTFEDKIRWSGDYSFCRKWRKLGGKIFVAPALRFEHFGPEGWKGMYSAFLNRQSGVHLKRVLQAVSEGNETAETIIEACMTYGNGIYAAQPDLIMTVIMLARGASGNILEIGTGLTTLVMAAANPNVKIWSLEHDDFWYRAITDQVKFYNFTNIEIVHAPLKDYGKFAWYAIQENLPSQFGMAVCDGPPRWNKGGRTGFRQLMQDRICDGAPIIFDDYDEYYKKEIAQWGGEIVVKSLCRPFAITTKKGSL